VPCTWKCASSLFRRLLGRSGFSVSIPENEDKIVSVPLNPDHSKNSQFAVCMGEDSGYHAGCALHPCQTSLTLKCDYVQIASDCGRQAPTLPQYFGVCELRTADQVAFSRDRAFFTPRPYLPTHCFWGWGCMSTHLMAKSTLQLYNGLSRKKQFHSTHTSNYPALLVDQLGTLLLWLKHL
jgi:hypothetical protein